MNLLQIEWLKIKKYNTFWLLFGLFTILFALTAYGLSDGLMKVGDFLTSSFAFPSVWSNLGHLYSWFVIFLCVFVIISISNEFTFKTHRQNIIDGLSRLDFLHAKLLLVLVIAFSATLFYTLVAIVLGLINGGGNPFNGIEAILYVFIFTLNYLTFAALIAFFIHRSGLSIILLLAFFLIESIVGSIINRKLHTQLGNLLPLQSSDELLPFNALKSMSKMVGVSEQELPVYYYIIASIVWITIYYFILQKKMNTTDL